MSEEIGYREMPPKKYTLIHVDARLTDADRKELTSWLGRGSQTFTGDAKMILCCIQN